jgi:lipopolysaccharide transport system permease protein
LRALKVRHRARALSPRRAWFPSRSSNGSSALGEDDHLATVVVEPRPDGLVRRGGEVWRYRRLLPYFGKQALGRLYFRTKLGWLWVPIRPILEVGTRALVFGSLLKAPSNGLPYFLFFVVGTTGWTLFSRALWWMTRSVEVNRKIVRKLYFPRLLMPLGSLIAAFIEFGIYIALCAVAVLYYVLTDGQTYLSFGVNTLLLVAACVVMLAFAIGIGLVTAVLGSHGRDTRFTLAYVLNFWFLLTPIIYPLSSLEGGFRTAAELNPMTAPIEMFRMGVFDIGELPSLALCSSLGSTLVVLAFGSWFFSRSEASATDAL